MFPPVFTIASASDSVKAVFGAATVRIFPFGNAPDNVPRPYAVWQIISGAPVNYISNTPDMDGFLTQIDVYAETASAARAGAMALRDAIEQHAHIVSWRGESRDSETKHYRYSFDINFLIER